MLRRSNGSGRLWARADSNGRETWYGSWYVGGRRVKRRVGLKRSPSCAEGLTRTMAEAALRRSIAGTSVVAPGQRLTVGEAATAYVDHLEHVMERKRTTIADYRGYVRVHLEPFFGATPLDRVDRARVEAYLLEKKRAGLASPTILKQLTFLHGVFGFAIKREWATSNPVALVDRPRAPRYKHRRLRFLTPEQLDAVIRAVRDDELGAVERPLYRTAAMTGVRQGELLALRWCDVDWPASRVRVAESYARGAFDSPNSHTGRSAPMADTLAAELERHFQATRWRGENDLAFAHPLTGNVLDASKLRKRFYEHVQRAGVPKLTFHELRHTFGTQMASAGAPLRSLQAWMGHADASTTEIYSHYAPDIAGARKLADRAFAVPALDADIAPTTLF